MWQNTWEHARTRPRRPLKLPTLRLSSLPGTPTFRAPPAHTHTSRPPTAATRPTRTSGVLAWHFTRRTGGAPSLALAPVAVFGFLALVCAAAFFFFFFFAAATVAASCAASTDPCTSSANSFTWHSRYSGPTPAAPPTPLPPELASTASWPGAPTRGAWWRPRGTGGGASPSRMSTAYAAFAARWPITCSCECGLVRATNRGGEHVSTGTGATHQKKKNGAI